MKTSLAILIFAAALGVGGGALAADPDAHSQHHSGTPDAGAVQTPPPQTQTPPAPQPAMDCKAMMGSGMMGGSPMTGGMTDHCMKPAADDKGAAQTPPQGVH